jgi:hypothetical protein
MTIKLWINFFLIASFLLWAAIWLFFGHDEYLISRFAPKPEVLALFLVGTAGIALVSNPLVQSFLSLWLLWPIAGTYFSITYYFQRKLWSPLYFDDANMLYMTNIIMLIFGSVVFQYFIRISRTPTFPKLENTRYFIPVLIFPLIYAATLMVTGPTFLTSTNIVNQIYSVDRGPIYAFRLVLVFYFVYCGLKLSEPSDAKKTVWLAAILFGIFASVLDGKRDMAILGILTIVFIQVAYFYRQNSLRPFVILGLTIIAYGLLANVRAGKNSDFETWQAFAQIAGVEYRDYVHSIVYWSPEWIETIGYNFWKSSAAMLVNSTVLELFGVNKTDWIVMDSARTWQRAFQQDVGIRLGLVAELHYQVGHWSKPIFFAMGALVLLLAKVLSSGISLGKTIAALIALAALQMAVFSQASAMFGYALTSLYIFIGLRLWRLFIDSSIER